LRFLAENSSLQTEPCGIYGSENVLELVRHIVAVELRHSQRLAGIPTTAVTDLPLNLAALEEIHLETMKRLGALLDDQGQDWAEVMEFSTLTMGLLRASRRKVLAHTLLHGIRHWAQVSTLARSAGFEAGIFGDLLASSALE
jgi:uncharacterized damage-inducible protein DinB